MWELGEGRTDPVADAAVQGLFAHSSESMYEIPDGAVTLTVTSPPYWNSIDYDVHADTNGSGWYRTRKYAAGYQKYDEYLEWCQRIFAEVLRVTRPGGHCAIVIGTVLLKGRQYPVPFDLVSRMTGSGWDFHQDIVWHKTTAGVKRAGVTIQKPYPGYYYPNIMTEYIMVLRKPGEPIYKTVSQETKESGQFAIDRVFTMDVANNVWHIAPVPPGVINHPCPFPEEIPYRLTQLYSYPGDLVLDPFLGSGQTAKVAAHLGRRIAGYDILQGYVDYAHLRISEPLGIRAKQLITRFEKALLNAPINGEQKRRDTVKREPAYVETTSSRQAESRQLLEKLPQSTKYRPS